MKYRDLKGRFVVKMGWYRKSLLAVMGFCVLVPVAAQMFPSKELSAVNVAEAAEVDTRELVDIGKAKRQLVRDLSDKCEFVDKAARPCKIDPKDSGGYQISCGDYQFLTETVQRRYKELYGVNLSWDEAMAISLSEEKAFDLAYDMVWKLGVLENEWTRCAHRADLRLLEQYKTIKSLEE